MYRALPIVWLSAALLALRAFAVDSLVVLPQHPTTVDSIHFSILTDVPCNCIQSFFPDSIAGVLSDTMVRLSYQKGTIACHAMPCVDTFRPPVSLSFKCGPLPAGTYGVYEFISYHCDSGMACTGIVMSRRMGSIIVTNPVSVLRNRAGVPVFGDRARNSGKIFTLRGELICRKAHQGRAAGMTVTVGKDRSLAVLKNSSNR